MKKLARTARDNGRAPETRAHEASPGVGLISQIGQDVRHLALPDARKSLVEAAGTRRKRERDLDAYRSTIDAGITGGVSLLLGGSRDESRRR